MIRFIPTLILTYFLLLPAFSSASEKLDLSSPRATMKTFLKRMKEHKQGLPGALEVAIQTFDLEHLDESAREDVARLAAVRLINTIDRMEYVDINTIPVDPKNDRWVFRETTVEVDGRQQEVEIALENKKSSANPEKNIWLFTPKTIDTIFPYYRSIKDKKIVTGVLELSTWKTKVKRKMPEWTGNKIFLFLNGQWLGLFTLLVVIALATKIIRIYAGFLTVSLLRRFKYEGLQEKLKQQFTLPVGIVFFFSFWIFGVKLLEFAPAPLTIMIKIATVAITFGLIFTIYRLVDVLSAYYEKKALTSDSKFDDILVPLLRKTSKFLVVALGAVTLGESLSFDMKSILAGLGIGGLAFALAAKDTLGNMFGSMTVLLDRPFQIGDWVNIGGDIEGTIEQVGLRSTRVRTFYDSLITVPNGKLTNIHIDNYGKRKYRRFNTKISIQYDTPPEKIEAFCEGIRRIILASECTRKDYFHVYLTGMGASSLDILLYVFWQVPTWSDELVEKHRLLVDIIRLGKTMGVEFAFPTQTLHVFQEEARIHDEAEWLEKFHAKGIQKARDIVERPLSFKKHRSSEPAVMETDEIQSPL